MEKLIGILQDMHPELDLNEEKGLIDHGILDSFDIVTLVMEIDDAYDVTIPAEQLLPENFNSVDSLYALIARLMD